jgi:uncharacterized protein YprB with RNaseH-like and TPR domain
LSSLADRIRGIVAPSGVAQGFSPADDANPVARIPVESPIPNPKSRDLSPLGGEWRHADGGSCFVVERRWEPSAQHGRARIGDLAERLDDVRGDAALLAGGAPARAPFVFLDLETTGLSGGAGTLAFLVGCAWFDEDGAFLTRQFLLTRYADERPLLDAVSGELARAGALVSFNGKSFDAPLLETRYLFHRLEWTGGGLPHVDVLHPARQFWKRGEGSPEGLRDERASARQESSVAQAFRPAQTGSSGCSLQALERQILGMRRGGDVPGFEIPERYFQFVRSGDARPLASVLEHNRLDLMTLAALTARLLALTRAGPDAARDAREALALGRVYARGGLDVRACDAFRRAVEMSEPAAGGSPATIRIDSLRSLAITLRRARQYADAAVCWRRLLDVPGCSPPAAREATEALAIHHEHRERDLAAAKAFALRSLETGNGPAWTNAARYRLARLERKLSYESLKFERLKSEGLNFEV